MNAALLIKKIKDNGHDLTIVEHPDHYRVYLTNTNKVTVLKAQEVSKEVQDELSYFVNTKKEVNLQQ